MTISNKILWFLFFFSSLSITNNPLSAQGYRRIIDISLKELNISYIPPQGYSELDSGFNSTQIIDTTIYYINGKPTLYGRGCMLTFYSIISLDSNVIASVSFMKAPDSIEAEGVRKITPNFDPNKFLFYQVNGIADKLDNRIIYYSKNEAKQKFNADEVVEGTSKCTLYNNFHNPKFDFRKYIYNRVVFIYKKNRGLIQLMYLFTKDAKNNIESEIEKTASMFYFNNDTINSD